MRAIADCASTLGSRFNIIFDPSARRIYKNSNCKFPGLPMSLTAAVELPDGRRVCLPFTDSEDQLCNLQLFPSLTGFTYSGSRQDLGLKVSLSVTSPFYPRDAKLSTAPFFFMKLRVRRSDGLDDSPQQVNKGKLVLSLDMENAGKSRLSDGFKFSLPPESVSQERDSGEGVSCYYWHGLDDYELSGDAIEASFDLTSEKKQSLNVLWSAWGGEAAVEIEGKASEFKYKSFFRSEKEMADWACGNRKKIYAKCRFLDSLFRDWSLGRVTTHFTSLAFHSFLANTWWLKKEDKDDWFSVWSGVSYYHSSIDIEYNNALLYMALWPELLDMQLRQWAGLEITARERPEHTPEKTSFLCRDMGEKYKAGCQAYPHYMEIEGNSDYLLLIAARTFLTGDLQFLRTYLPLCRRLAAFIVDSDTDGDGLPDEGMLNTVNDAGPAVHFSKAQTYLSVKSQAALWAMGELEELEGKEAGKGGSERWKAFVAKGVKTLSENAWVKDHYAVSLIRDTHNMVDPDTGEPLAEGELKGWDDYSIYTSNGALYLFFVNMKMPRWNHGRFMRDLKTSESATRTPYGCRHTSGAENNVWFSQNLWRDYVAAYYGVDFLNKIEDYWDYQLVEECGNAPFIYRDSRLSTRHLFHSRGATVFGASMAAAGLRINRVEKEIHISPIRRTLKVPMLPFVDWEKMKAPWINVQTTEGVTTVRVTNQELLEGFKIKTFCAEMDKT